ncbi:hypothetical protein M976_03780 [Buttiauxella ferragutiae ATCC 51602]|uniref:Uncharacterized protein n=1 Tax=Buttiauxella ferragutiae ATCC 51602 TaxID=1354252 RepID=A0ABX2W3Z7_9ENTR|nr:hypothetical protein M976_03780 [Buttiauxella ferragutiae ATCC 51602]
MINFLKAPFDMGLFCISSEFILIQVVLICSPLINTPQC